MAQRRRNCTALFVGASVLPKADIAPVQFAGGQTANVDDNFRLADKPLVIRALKDGQVQLRAACRKRDK